MMQLPLHPRDPDAAWEQHLVPLPSAGDSQIPTAAKCALSTSPFPVTLLSASL